MIEKEEFFEFIGEIESSLSQVKEMDKGKIKKERARDFLNEL